MTYSIGAMKIAEGEATRGRIETFFRANPFSTQRECAKALNLAEMTVSKHVKVLRARQQTTKLTEQA